MPAVVTLAVLAACSSGSTGDDDAPAAAREEPAAQVAVFDTPYCQAARHWAVHELDGSADGAYARGGPTALHTWWDEQQSYLTAQVGQAPDEIRDAEALNERDVRTRLTPLLEKYGFDLERFDQEATAAEQTRAEHGSRRVAEAQRARDEFQNRECGSGGSPPPAEVRFEGDASAKAYCRAARAQEHGMRDVVESGFEPGAFRAYATSDSFLDALDAQEAAAPAEIAADVRADNQWVREQKLTLLERFGYDLRRLLEEGTAAELSAFSYWDPRIIDQDRRVEAFVSQVCGVE